jgi:hypothetical protein
MPLIPSDQLPLRTVETLAARPARGPAARPDVQPTPRPWPLESADEVLARRRATRDYTGDALSQRDLATVIERAFAAELALWPGERHGEIGFTIVVAAFRVEGLVSGLYIADPDKGINVNPAQSEPLILEQLRSAYTNAACLVGVCADFAAAGAGKPGYGPLLIRAGTVGYGAWLAAVDIGFAGCAFGAPHHAITEVAQLFDSCSRHVFTVAVGTAAPQPGTIGPATPDEEIQG